MKILSGMFAEAYASWLSSVANCCAPLASCIDERQRHSIAEKPANYIYQDQPELVPPPVAELTREARWPGTGKERVPRKSFASARSSFSVRKRFNSNASSRRPQISAPSNFRHIQSESFQFPTQAVRRPRPASFRPLELSIYMPDNELSPILPLFDVDNILPPPPPAKLHQSRSRDDDGFSLSHERSYSSMSFHLPRRSPSATQDDGFTPASYMRTRPRANTSPAVERIVERIASAMIEVERLQDQINDVVERQSIYVSSRPSTAHSMAFSKFDSEPLPSIPALPPAAPSFAERLNSPVSATSERPHTAPSKAPVHIPHRAKTFNEAQAPFNSIYGSGNTTPTQSRPMTGDHPPPPPLPLVLRPPLRKKKSFSRVSTWLFPEGHSRDISLDSITNLPRPVKDRDGYYQCVSPVAEGQRRSFDTVSTVSTWETEDEERTVPTTWSPGSTPAAKSPPTILDEASRQPEASPLGRMPAFGKAATPNPRRVSVGVAF